MKMSTCNDVTPVPNDKRRCPQKINMFPYKRTISKTNVVFQPSFFRGELLVLEGEYHYLSFKEKQEAAWKTFSLLETSAKDT